MTVGGEPQPTRLNVFLAARLAPEYSRSRIARFIRAGLVTINGAPARAASLIRHGDRIEVAPAPLPPQPPEHAAPPPEIEVLYADPELIAVNKPPGMAVHRAPGHPHSTLVDAMLARFPDLAAMAEPEGVPRPGIVHRLDKDTSGVMVVARTPFACASLARQFKERIVRKVYLAIVRGIVARDAITIARPVGRHPVERKRMSTRSRHGREAVSHVTVLARFKALDATLVRIRPETGRTHQIRVHLASIGHPCLGDPLYGGGARAAGAAAGFERQALHALALTVDHPRTGRRLQFVARPTPDLVAFLNRAGISSDAQTLARWIDTDVQGR